MSGSEILRTESAAATESLGKDLAANLRAGDVLLLEGDLAAGKTTLVRGLLDGLGGDPVVVSSPSFVLLQSYDCDSNGINVLHHLDLYRLGERIADLREIGVEEILSDQAAVVAVEWPKDTLATWIPADARTWRIALTTEDDDSRRIEITPPRFLNPQCSAHHVPNSDPDLVPDVPASADHEVDADASVGTPACCVGAILLPIKLSRVSSAPW